MPLSEHDRRALRRLEQQLGDDAGIDEALRSLQPPRRRKRSVAPVVAVVVGSVAVFALLAVSFIASFVAFVVVLVATAFVIRGGVVQRRIDSMRTIVSPSNSNKNTT